MGALAAPAPSTSSTGLCVAAKPGRIEVNQWPGPPAPCGQAPTPPNLKRRPVAVVVRGVGLLRLMVFDPVGGQIFLLSCAVRLVQKPVLA